MENVVYASHLSSSHSRVCILHILHVQGLKSNTWIRVCWDTLKHDSCSTITERTIDNAGVSRDPTNVSDTGKDVFVRVVVKGILQERGGREKESETGKERERGGH